MSPEPCVPCACCCCWELNPGPAAKAAIASNFLLWLHSLVRSPEVTVESEGGITQGLVATCRWTLNCEITEAQKHLENFINRVITELDKKTFGDDSFFCLTPQSFILFYFFAIMVLVIIMGIITEECKTLLIHLWKRQQVHGRGVELRARHALSEIYYSLKFWAFLMDNPWVGLTLASFLLIL